MLYLLAFEILPFETIWVDLESIIVSIISQTKNSKYFMVLLYMEKRKERRRKADFIETN